MRVLFFIWNYWPGIEGGSERQARQVATELASQGHTCIIWTAWLSPCLPKEESKDGTTIVRFGRWVPWQTRSHRILDAFHKLLQKITRKIFANSDKPYAQFKKHFDFWILLPVVYLARFSFMKEVSKYYQALSVAPDIIHLHEPSWLGGFAVQLAKEKKIPILCQEATNPALPVLGYDVPKRNRMEHFRRDAHFIAMAPYIGADLLVKGVLNEKVHILPNGVEIPTLKEPRTVSPLVLYVGNFSQGAHWKAFDVLFDSWQIVHEQQLGLRLVVLGGGDRYLWEKYVDKLGCASTVDFIGRVSNPGDYYQKAAIFILPSRVEGMSNALLEAQSWGLPCVVSDIPGNTSVVQNGVNGLVVAVNDPQAFASAVVKLYHDKGLQKKIGDAARNLMQEKYEIHGVIKRLFKIYEQVKKMELDGKV
jgi:glycosyltransferase involved in cell wall biosynthesis